MKVIVVAEHWVEPTKSCGVARVASGEDKNRTIVLDVPTFAESTGSLRYPPFLRFL